MNVEEMVIGFFHINAPYTKNRVVKCQITRSDVTVSRYFHVLLKVVLRLHSIYFKKSELIPKNSTDDKWKWFKVLSWTHSNYNKSLQNLKNIYRYLNFLIFILFLGTLNGTHINVNVMLTDKPRSRKNEIATNVLSVCITNKQFVYVIQRWESSIIDCKVFKDVIIRKNDLKVPRDNA